MLWLLDSPCQKFDYTNSSRLLKSKIHKWLASGASVVRVYNAGFHIASISKSGISPGLDTPANRKAWEVLSRTL